MDFGKSVQDWTAEEAEKYCSGVKWALLERFESDLESGVVDISAYSKEIEDKTGYKKGTTMNIMFAMFFCGIAAGFNFWFDVTGTEESGGVA